MGKKKKKRTLGGVVKDIKTVAKSSAMLKPGVSGITSANSAAAKRLAKDALNVTVGSSAAALIAKALKTNPGTIGKARPKKKK